MSPEQVRAMVDAVPDRYRALVILLAGAGLRPAEGLGLTVDRVDFLRRTIRVDRQLVTVSGRSPFLAPPKTPSSVRTIPVPQAVVDALAAHVRDYAPGPDGLVFTDCKSDPVRRNAIGHVWRRAATACGRDRLLVARPSALRGLDVDRGGRVGEGGATPPRAHVGDDDARRVRALVARQ